MGLRMSGDIGRANEKEFPRRPGLRWRSIDTEAPGNDATDPIVAITRGPSGLYVVDEKY